jgi:hypothetical protein
MSYAGPENIDVKADASQAKEEAQDRPPYDDKTMLQMVRVEMQRSVGFENDQALRADRLRALDYYKGDMKADIPSLPNRSRAVSSDIADAVETILPDIMEIFTAGGDVAVFEPVKPGDEDAARQETDYLNHVIFQENPGFLNLMTGFKDGLLLKTCLFEFGWKKDYQDEDFSGKSLQELMLAHQSGQVVNVKADPPDHDYPSAQQTYSFTVRSDCSRAEYWAVPPDDFSVSPDTIRIADATYCVVRSRPRVQDLIAEGFDEDIVLKLEPYAPVQDQQIQLARDTAGEHLQSQTTDTTTDMLRQVEIRKHYIRLKDREGEDFDIWRVVTNATADKLIEIRKEQRIPFAAGSPYLVAHRFYGLSLADQLVSTQQIKTVLTRSLLDSSYFALNQRYEVAMDQANDYTISDLLRNEPAVPVRSKTGQAVRPLTAGGLGFDAYAALEYFSTVGEMRSGVVRNAQGLNPDTLHDTAKGAMALMQAAQRRVRMIARVLAETCIKELYLGLHSLIRENAEASSIVRLNGKWVPIDPTTWGERNAMTIEVGLGAAGREADLAALNTLASAMNAIVLQQGGAVGPIVTLDNAYNAAIDLAKALGRKQPERYFTDPQNAPPVQAKPDPNIVKAQIQAQTAMQKAGIDAQVKQNANQTQAILKQQQTAVEAQLKKYEIDQSNATEIATAAIDGHVKHKVAQVGIGGNQV